ncbi:MAG: DUF1697 domain-containing protein [Dermatophilaceae bacterium]
MATYIAFLRAINVGGRFVKMADLRTGLSDKGFGEVESYIQSGNLRFRSGLRSVAAVELAVETALEELCGFTVRAIVRTPALLGELTSYGMGLTAPVEGEVRRYVTFLKEDPDDELVAMMRDWNVPGERAHVNGRDVHVWLAHPSHEAKLTNARIERGGVVATTRDWKVVSALGEKWGA